MKDFIQYDGSRLTQEVDKFIQQKNKSNKQILDEKLNPKKIEQLTKAFDYEQTNEKAFKNLAKLRQDQKADKLITY